MNNNQRDHLDVGSHEFDPAISLAIPLRNANSLGPVIAND